MKVVETLFLGSLFIGTSCLTGVANEAFNFFIAKKTTEAPPVVSVAPMPATPDRQSDVPDVVTKALAFKASLSASQQATLEQTYTASLARKWSNLPCGSGCRNGIQLGSLTSAQLGLALEVIKAAAGTASNEGYDEFYQIRLADYVLGHQYGANGYDSTIYFLAFLNTPTATGQWMLQYGGHHYASNIGFNGGKVVGPTPQFRGVEPTSFTVNGTTYAPLNDELTALQNMLASFSTAQLATAKNASTFSDCVMVPGETNGGASSFPAKAGIQCSNLSSAQQALVLAALEPYIQDIDATSAAALRNVYASGIDNTYVTWTGSGTSGNASSFLNTNTNYVRIDGPSVWVEFICQNGVVISNQIHYHTVWRDHVRDYGANLTLTALPLTLLAFEVKSQGNDRVLSWRTAEESNITRYEIERSTTAAGGFSTIGQVTARNATDNSYAYTDNARLTNGNVYYRLKIVENSGTLHYSKIVALNNTAGNSFSIHPNPAKNKVTLTLSASAIDATISVLDASGKTVLVKKGQAGNEIEVNVNALVPGSYYLQVRENGKVTSLNFIKQ